MPSQGHVHTIGNLSDVAALRPTKGQHKGNHSTGSVQPGSGTAEARACLRQFSKLQASTRQQVVTYMARCRQPAAGASTASNAIGRYGSALTANVIHTMQCSTCHSHSCREILSCTPCATHTGSLTDSMQQLGANSSDIGTLLGQFSSADRISSAANHMNTHKNCTSLLKPVGGWMAEPSSQPASHHLPPLVANQNKKNGFVPNLHHHQSQVMGAWRRSTFHTLSSNQPTHNLTVCFFAKAACRNLVGYYAIASSVG